MVEIDTGSHQNVTVGHKGQKMTESGLETTRNMLESTDTAKNMVEIGTTSHTNGSKRCDKLRNMAESTPKATEPAESGVKATRDM